MKWVTSSKDIGESSIYANLGTNFSASIEGYDSLYLEDSAASEEFDDDLNMERHLYIYHRVGYIDTELKRTALNATRADAAKKEAAEFLRQYFSPIMEVLQ